MATPEPQPRREVRLERMLAHEVRAAMDAAPVAWVPWGAIEFHAQHLPFGTDGFTAHRVLELAAQRVGGIVLPWTALTIGTLQLEWTLRYEPALVEAALRQTIEQLAAHGARVVVVHTGHGPLDLDHLIKRVCAEVEAGSTTPESFRAYGLCYLELNAALGTGLGTDWPVAVDHGATMETSWMMAIEPDLVHLDRLPSDPDATGIVGVYGPNPRSRADADVAATQISAASELLADRVEALLAGEQIDTMADLRTFVARYWPETLRLEGRAGEAGSAAVLVSNPAPVSRYLTSLALRFDGAAMDPAKLRLVNPTLGEVNEPLPGDALGPEAGFYVRRGQSAEVRLPQAVAAGDHEVDLDLGLAGVTSVRISERVTFT